MQPLDDLFCGLARFQPAQITPESVNVRDLGTRRGVYRPDERDDPRWIRQLGLEEPAAPNRMRGDQRRHRLPNPTDVPIRNTDHPTRTTEAISLTGSSILNGSL